MYNQSSICERKRLKPGEARDKSESERLTACEFPLKNGEISIIGVKRFDRAAFPQEDLNEGMIQLREAIRLDPRSVSLRQELAMTLIWDGRYDDAMAESRAIAAIDPNRAHGYSLACCFFSVGELDRAIELLQEEIQRIPGASYDLNLIGMIHYQRGRKDKAFAAFRESLFRAIEDPEFQQLVDFQHADRAGIDRDLEGGHRDLPPGDQGPSPRRGRIGTR